MGVMLPLPRLWRHVFAGCRQDYLQPTSPWRGQRVITDGWCILFPLIGDIGWVTAGIPSMTDCKPFRCSGERWHDSHNASQTTEPAVPFRRRQTGSGMPCVITCLHSIWYPIWALSHTFRPVTFLPPPHHHPTPHLPTTPTATTPTTPGMPVPTPAGHRADGCLLPRCERSVRGTSRGDLGGNVDGRWTREWNHTLRQAAMLGLPDDCRGGRAVDYLGDPLYSPWHSRSLGASLGLLPGPPVFYNSWAPPTGWAGRRGRAGVGMGRRHGAYTSMVTLTTAGRPY